MKQRENRKRWVAAGAAALIAVGVALGACALRESNLPQDDPESEPEVGAGLSPEPGEIAGLSALAERVRPLQLAMGEVQPGDWLASYDEAGQTFRAWLKDDPTTARGERRVIYVLPLGTMSPLERKVVEDSADYLARYFQLPVTTLDSISEDTIPDDHRREGSAGHQLHSEYILDEVLYPRVPKDAAALIAFTAIDLYPEPSWNFVFGQASLSRRVGVWSMARNGNPKRNYKLVLERTIGTATHETGHMFSMHHCTAYLCNLCGSNSMAESDRHPVQVCAECLPKLLFATRADPIKRFESLIEFCDEHQLEDSGTRYRALLEATKSGEVWRRAE